MSKNTSNKETLDSLVEKIIKNSEEDRELADKYINDLINELQTTSNPIAISAQSIQKFMEIKVKANDALVKLSTNVQKREQLDKSKKGDLSYEDDESVTEDFIENLYEKFSVQKTQGSTNDSED